MYLFLGKNFCFARFKNTEQGFLILEFKKIWCQVQNFNNFLIFTPVISL